MASSKSKKLTVAIVGTGPSVKNQRIDGDIVIAVNQAIDICQPDTWFCLDPSPSNLAIIDRSKPDDGILYVVAFPDEIDTPSHVERLRRISMPKQYVRQPWQTDAQYWLFRWGCRLSLSENAEEIHTGNAAYGALGYVYLCRHGYKWICSELEIILYGIDGTDEEKVTGGKPNRLDHLPLLFESAVPQLKANDITVLNASPDSRVTCFRRYHARPINE